MNIERLLKETDVFREIDESARKAIADQGVLRSIRQNKQIFFEGEKGLSFYLLVDGAVKLFKTGSDGHEVTMRVAKPKETFAEAILFENDLYPVSAVAVADSKVFTIQRSIIVRMLESADFRHQFIAGLMKRIRYLANRILYLTTYSVEERFFEFLQDRYGEQTSYDIRLSKKDIAAAIGTTPETLSRLILRMRKIGVFEWEKNVLKLKKDYWED